MNMPNPYSTFELQTMLKNQQNKIIFNSIKNVISDDNRCVKLRIDGRLIDKSSQDRWGDDYHNISYGKAVAFIEGKIKLRIS